MSGPDDTWESMLVKVTLATITNEATGIYSGSDTIADSSGEMILFTRSQATFASTALPTNTVHVTALVTEFLIPELAIRNLDDVQITPSVPEHDWAGSISLFPNPAGNNFTVSMLLNPGNYEMSVTDITGKLIYVAETNNLLRTEVNTENFDSGIYFVLFRFVDLVVTKKLAVLK
jgi:hypothetical protein